MNGVLPQDDNCGCGRRVGNHNQYEMWVCCQKFGKMVRILNEVSK